MAQIRIGKSRGNYFGVIGRGNLIVWIHSGWFVKMAAGSPQTRGFLIHSRHELVHGQPGASGQSAGRVVGRRQKRGVEKPVNRKFYAGFGLYARAAGTARAG